MAHLQGDEKRRYVADLYARIAPYYDAMNDVMTFGFVRRWRAEAARVAAEGPEGRVLDVASGTGDLTLALSRHVAQVVGLDLLPGMVRRARRKALRRGAYGVEFVVGDGLSLPFCSASLAVVSTAFGLRNMPDISAAMGEMVRVLCPEGRLVVLELVPPHYGSGLIKAAVRLYLRWVVPFLGGLLVREREAYGHLFRSAERFPSPERLASMMAEAGLVDVSFRLLGFGAVAIHQGTKPL